MEPPLVISIISLVVSAVSLVVSIGVFIRSIYLDRPNLLFIHSRDDTEESFVRTPNPNEVIGTATLIISNKSSRPNVVIDWSASVRDAQGNLRNVEMPRTTLGEYGRMNVRAIALLPFTAVEAHVFFAVDVRTLPNPVIFQVTATDGLQKAYSVSVSIPNVVRATLTDS